ncbi:hypothetical protein TNCV_4009521 [Trichonephila clavipes]|nr:hypothetical protein TNCV_4009521 [Trichonephila clavipes]
MPREYTNRSISALKRVKTEMRSTMENKRLNSLMLLCTQNDTSMEFDYKEVINDFALIKARKKPLLYLYNDSDNKEYGCLKSRDNK